MAAAELRLGQINDLLAPISITAEGLARLGIHHARIDRAALRMHLTGGKP